MQNENLCGSEALSAVSPHCRERDKVPATGLCRSGHFTVATLSPYSGLQSKARKARPRMPVPD